MATGKKSNSPMKNLIRESIKEMHTGDGAFPSDPTLEIDGEIKTGPARFAKDQKTKDEIVIDKLLAPIQNKSGYFMKLKKELRPGEWMLMKTIENDWRKWADIETEVANIVKAHTIKSPGKWGSGPYRIEYGCTSGMRGETYPDVDMHINAEEEYITTPTAQLTVAPAVDANVAVGAQIDTLANLVGMLKNFLPPAADPNKQQEQVASAFQQGMQLKLQEASGNKDTMAVMMTGIMGMMTAMMQNQNNPRIVNPDPDGGMKGMLDTLKTFGLIGQQQQVKEKSTIEFITELKALGLDLLKKDDPIQQMSQLKALANVAGEFMGMGSSGEKPGILEKLVDTFAPVLPGMIKDLKDTATAAQSVQIEAGKNIERARITTTNGPMNNPIPQGSTMNVGSGPSLDNSNPQVAQFFAGLYEAVTMNNRMFYPVVYTSLLQDAQGQALLQGIANGTHTAKEVIELLQQHGGEKYRDSEFVMKKLVSYTNGFIIWIRDMMKPQKSNTNAFGNPAKEIKNEENIGGFDAKCPLCDTVYSFESEQDYVVENDKSCEVMNNGVLCPGQIQPMQKAS